MTKYATMNPPGSTSPYDLFDNSQNFDTAINSITAAIWQDRLGKSRHTWYGIESLALISMLNYGYITKKSFEQGTTLDTPNTVLQLESNGEYYRWDGEWSQPKVVPPGSTPESAGGVGPGKWVGVGDASLRGQLSDQDGVEKYPELQMSRWRDEGDIRGWGAIGDADEAGTSGRDDTAAIQAALNSGKKKLKIPANHYFLVTQTLVVPSGISLVGEDQFSSCIVAAPSMDGILDVMHNAGYNAPTVTFDKNIAFSNFRIHANGFSRIKSNPDVEWGRCLRTGALKGLSIDKMVFQEGPQHCLDIACWKDAYIGVGHAGVVPGMTTDVRVTDSYLIDYCYDDGLTTHGADGVTVSNCTAMITDYAKSKHEYSITQNGFEIDDGSSNVVVSNCRTYGNDTNSKGFAVANHDGNPIPYNIKFENCDAYETVTGVATLGVADASHPFGSEAYRGRNYAIINCSLNYPHVAMDNAEFPSRGYDIQYGMDVVVENFRVNLRGQNGEASRTPCSVFNIIGCNVRIDGVRVEGVPDGQLGTIFGTGRAWFRITNNNSSKIQIHNVDIDNIGWADRVIRDVDKNPGGALTEVSNITIGRNSTDGRTKTGVMSQAFGRYVDINLPSGMQTLRVGRTLTDRTSMGKNVNINYDSPSYIVGGLRIFSETAADNTQPCPGLLFDRQFVNPNNYWGKGSIAFRTSSSVQGTFSITAFDEDTNTYEPLTVWAYTPSNVIKKYLAPVKDGDTNNGNAASRWLNVHSVNGVITTSDADDKTGLRDTEEIEDAAFSKIARLPSVWKWIRRVEEEGDDARWHSGPTVQAAIAIMDEFGLKWSEYSCFCYDHQPYVPESRVVIPAQIDEVSGLVISPEREVITPAIEESETYGFRKEELLWWCMRAMASQLDRMEERLARLESQ
ncbi:TPA: tail fiber domain-containing protein [Escherichia coli]